VASPFWSWPRVAAIAAAISIAALLGGSVVWLRTRPPVGRVSRFGLASSATGGVQFSLVDRDIAISPDGDRIAWVGTGGTILVRALDQVEPTLLTGLGTPRGLFFSPNGQSIGFFDGQIALKRIAVAGGPPVVVCRIAASSRGAAWLADDTIVFATNQSGGGLLRVPASGGEPTSLAKPNRERGEAAYLWPEVVTGRQAVLFTIAPTTAGSVDNFQIAVLDLQSGTPRVLLRGGTDAHYLSSGHLVYGAGGTLRATRIDPARLEIVGTPATVLPQVGISSFGAVNFDMASDATLAYVPSGAQLEARSIVWVDREGREEPTKVPRHAYSYARLSPDGTQLALDARDQESDIWLWHFNRETLTRLTFDPAPDRFPVWAADGRRVFFGSDRTGLSNIFSQAVDGTGAPERVTNSSSQQFPMAVSPDGKTLVYRDASPTMALMTVSLDAEHLVRPLLKTAFAHQNAEISPDGRWMAFESNDSGQFEVFVRPFPNVDSGRWQISTKGGIQPLWSRNGQELFYLVPGGGLMGVRVERGASWNASAPTKLMDERFYHGGGSGSGTGRTYDISPDGRRFLMIKQGESNGAAASLIVVQNWGEELRRLTAPK
jgi:eukaryotic-like serine/threonine-protein kinase